MAITTAATTASMQAAMAHSTAIPTSRRKRLGVGIKLYG
jgi:hypothetical protein